MRARSAGLTLGVGIPVGAVAAFCLLSTSAAATQPAAGAIAGGLGLVLGAIAWRILISGIQVRADAVVVRAVFWSRRVPLADVAGVAVVPVLRRRAAGLAVVTEAGDVVGCPFAVWKMGSPLLWQSGTAAAVTTGGARVAAGLPVGSAAPVLEAAGRLERAAALTATLPDGNLLAVPAAIPDPGLTPATVSPVTDDSARRYLRIETVAVTLGFVLPALAAAITILSRHLEGVSELNEFDLPLPHDPAVSLLLMLLLYASTAVVTPLALLFLARSGQPPAALHLTRRGLRDDIGPAVALLLAAFVSVALLALILRPLLDNGSNAAEDSHVPAYFVIYGLFVSAVTALNEELVVNAYLMTRLSQLGFRPWWALTISLVARTSYHSYYGLAIVLTVPFGYFVTRSFQKHGRIGRAILTHFTYDAILLTVAVLTS